MGLIGLEAKMYRNTASFATPAWSEVDNISSVSQNDQKGLADQTRRANNGRRDRRGTIKEDGITFTMFLMPEIASEKAEWDAFRDAFRNNTLLDLLFCDGDVATSGNDYTRGSFDVTQFNRSEDLEEVVTAEVTIVFSSSADQQDFSYGTTPLA